MSENVTIRLDSETAKTLKAIKAGTGIGAAQIARSGIQKAIAQFKTDGFLKMGTTDHTTTNTNNDKK